jgi:hypothetical protein
MEVDMFEAEWYVEEEEGQLDIMWLTGQVIFMAAPLLSKNAFLQNLA